MEITPEDARIALRDIQRASEKARYMRNMGAYYWLLWGTIITVGFLVNQFWPQWSENISIALNCIGLAGWVCLARRQNTSMRLTPGSQASFLQSRLHIFYILYVIFSFLWWFILQSVQAKQMGLFFISVYMFVIITSGVWLQDVLLIAIGVCILLLALVGYYLFPPLFWIWEASFAGLPIVAMSIYYLRRK